MAFELLGPEAPETHIDDLASMLGTRFGPGEWHQVDQQLFDEFSDVTGDRAWYHVDPERARAELPNGKTIAHGLLTLSLVPALYSQVFRLGHAGRGLNYGYDKLRFIAPVQAGDRIRITAVPSEITPHARGSVVRVGLTVEIERDAQIALVGDQLLFVFPQD
jgi:acyl dehydratase